MLRLPSNGSVHVSACFDSARLDRLHVTEQQASFHLSGALPKLQTHRFRAELYLHGFRLFFAPGCCLQRARSMPS